LSISIAKSAVSVWPRRVDAGAVRRQFDFFLTELLQFAPDDRGE
jgi:hypothetical protein